jgi:hypothetical protein
MPGTVLQQLTTTPLTDNTAMTSGPGNTGFDSHSLGASNTGVHLTAARMGEPAGFRLTQGGTAANIWYLDHTAPIEIFAFRMPFRYTWAATPASVVLLRIYDTAAHTGNLGSLQVTVTNRVQFVEPGTGGLNVMSPSASPLIPGNDYVALGLINTTTMAFTTRVYPRDSTTEVFAELTGTMAFVVDIQSIRWGIGTGTITGPAVATADTNSSLAIGSGDFLARTDLTNTPPDAGANQTVEPYAQVTLDATDAETATTWTQTAGSPTVISPGSANPVTFEAPATRAGTTLTFTVTDAGGLTDTKTVTVYPHNEWALIDNVEVPMRFVAAGAGAPATTALYGSGRYGIDTYG